MMAKLAYKMDIYKEILDDNNNNAALYEGVKDCPSLVNAVKRKPRSGVIKKGYQHAMPASERFYYEFCLVASVEMRAFPLIFGGVARGWQTPGCYACNKK